MNGPVLGAVLAGGRSSRFGSDKARALLDGRALLDHVVAALEPQVDAVLICGRPHPVLPWVPDRPGPDLGPLGGLCAALSYARDGGFAGVVSVGCDLPRLPDDLVGRLVGDGAAIVEGCPIVGYWPSPLADDLLAHLGRGGTHAVRAWARTTGAREIRPAVPLLNVNTPADLLRAAGEALQAASGRRA